MRLVFAEPAAEDIDDIVAYIGLDSPSAAEGVFRAIAAAAERLAEFPGLGRAGRLPDTREWPVVSLPYVIIYQVRGEDVVILAVFHTARNLARAMAERRRALDP